MRLKRNFYCNFCVRLLGNPENWRGFLKILIPMWIALEIVVTFIRFFYPTTFSLESCYSRYSTQGPKQTCTRITENFHYCCESTTWVDQNFWLNLWLMPVKVLFFVELIKEFFFLQNFYSEWNEISFISLMIMMILIEIVIVLRHTISLYFLELC